MPRSVGSRASSRRISAARLSPSTGPVIVAPPGTVTQETAFALARSLVTGVLAAAPRSGQFREGPVSNHRSNRGIIIFEKILEESRDWRGK
jgi:hypothetical protein